jgi:hypothetical protein
VSDETNNGRCLVEHQFCNVAQLYVSYKIQQMHTVYMAFLNSSLINRDLVIGTNMIGSKCISCSYPSTLHHNAFVVLVVAAAVDGQLQERKFIIHHGDTFNSDLAQVVPCIDVRLQY